MQLATTIGSQLLAAGSAAAAGASSAAGGAGSLLGAAKAAMGAKGFLGAVQTGTSALSALSSFAGGMADKRQAEAAALESRYEAKAAIIRGAQESNEILDRVIDDQARGRAAYAAAGVDPFSGTAARRIARLGRDGEADIEIAGGDALARYLSRRRSAKALKSRGAAAGVSGLVRAAATLGQGYLDLKDRG